MTSKNDASQNEKKRWNNTISLSCHEQVCLIGLRFERYFSHHWATMMRWSPMMGEVSLKT